MGLRKKIIIIVGFCLILSITTIIMITNMFDNFEDQLLQKCRIESLVGARVMNTFMKLMIHTNQITAQQLTDYEYKEIPGTSPRKYNTPFDAVFDGAIQKFQDEFLKDEDVVFSVLFDKKGYVPTHNTQYSLPQNTDSKKSLMYSRSKRIFGDAIEIKEILRYKGKGVGPQYPYHRDTGEVMWNVGAPVNLNGAYWGAFIIGISLQRIDIIKNQMVIIIVTIMIINLSFTLLMILAVIPQKYLTPKTPEASENKNEGI